MLYVTRHGQTSWNVDDMLCGRSDVELNERGKRQACDLGSKLANKGYKFDRIISSPLKRAKETAQLVAKQLGFPLENIESDSRLVEIAFGELEGTPVEFDFHNVYRRNFACHYPEGGESVFQAVHRIYSFLDDLKSQIKTSVDLKSENLSQKDKDILVVCHGGIARLINTYFYDMTNEAYLDWSLDNTELKSYNLL